MHPTRPQEKDREAPPLCNNSPRRKSGRRQKRKSHPPVKKFPRVEIKAARTGRAEKLPPFASICRKRYEARLSAALPGDSLPVKNATQKEQSRALLFGDGYAADFISAGVDEELSAEAALSASAFSVSALSSAAGSLSSFSPGAVTVPERLVLRSVGMRR